MLPQPIVIEFRDGDHSVPPHVASDIAIAEIDASRYTYEEAVALARDALLKNHLNGVQHDLVYKHFRDYR